LTPPTIIYDNATLRKTYHQLQPNDIICGRVRLKPGEEYLLTDLVERGVRFLPSATSQLASRSKVFQTQLCGLFMLPGTRTIHDQHSLLCATTAEEQLRHGEVILKRDRKNGGIGIHRFRSMEDLYNQVSGGGYLFPFVVQPFKENCQDIRVIILGDYIEAYERQAPCNFRHNLHCGGAASPYQLTDKQLSFCRQVMKRAAFPYGHIDLLLDDNECWLSEINLRGGLRGAKIKGKEYEVTLAKVHQQLLATVLANQG
jgi:glutathione synthase/RimK-type ligase-like ATP-grasp enzyme